MPAPEIIDLDPASDARFRDVYGRHHHRMVSRSGNLISTNYHHVNGAQANLSAAEIVSVDASNNAQYDLILRNSANPIAAATLTNANISTWSASSLLSLRQDTTSIRSATLAVENVSSAGNIAATGSATLGSTVIRTFQKSLATGSGNVSEICTITGTNLTFAGHLYVVQAETGKACLTYSLCVSAQNGSGGTTNGAWHRLLPISAMSAPSLFGVAAEINVDTEVNGQCKIRLVRAAGAGTSANFECVLVLQQSRDTRTITITDSTVTASGQTLATAFFKGTALTQVNGNVGIGTDTPTHALTVAGTANVQSLIVSGNATLDGTVQGTAVTQSVTNGSNALVTSNGVFKYVEATVSGSLDLTSLSTGNVTANNITIRTDGVSKLDNMIVRSFVRTLGTTIGNAVEVCSMVSGGDTFMVELNLVQSSASQFVYAKSYKFGVDENATGGSWHRLVPIVSSNPAVAVEINVNATTATLRLVRVAGSEAANIECNLIVHQSRAHPVTITSLTGTPSVTLSSTLYKHTALTQLNGNVGIGTDAPTDRLTVAGNTQFTGTTWAANSESVLASTTGPLVYYRQMLQPCVFRGTFVITAVNAPFTGITVNITGPYINDQASCLVVVSNGDYVANSTFHPMSGSVSGITSNQITQLAILYTCNNTNAARISYAILFTPR